MSKTKDLKGTLSLLIFQVWVKVSQRMEKWMLSDI